MSNQQAFVQSPLLTSQLTVAKKEAPLKKSASVRQGELLELMPPRYKLFAVCFMQGMDGAKAAAMAGYIKSPKQSANKILKNRYVAEYIAVTQEYMRELMPASFEWKINKLVKCVDASIPEEGEINVQAGVCAISEMNKMQGHYAPTKNLNLNANVEANRDEVRGLLEQYKREY